MPNTWNATAIQFLTQPDLRAFFRVITRKRDRALFLIAYRHGLRALEVGLLHVDDLNFEQQWMTIQRLKRSLPGIYPLRADEVTALKAYLRERKSPSPTLFLSQRGTPIFRRQLNTLMKHYGELCSHAPAGAPPRAAPHLRGHGGSEGHLPARSTAASGSRSTG